MPSRPEEITPNRLRDWSLPEPGASKHSRGDILVVGGARSTPGAAMLAGLAALRVGAGVMMLAVAESVAPHVAVAIPESGVTGLPESASGSVLGTAAQTLAPRLERAGAVLVGPGLDDGEQTAALLHGIADVTAPVVLDAYAIGSLERGMFAGRLVLTPNVSEGARLLDCEADDLSGEQALVDGALEIARRYEAVVTMQNVISTGEQAWRVSSGHPGLGTSGSGDVLAGAVLGLLGRGATMEQAACFGTYLHAMAGDRLAARVGRLGFLARELLDELPLVLTELRT